MTDAPNPDGDSSGDMPSAINPDQVPDASPPGPDQAVLHGHAGQLRNASTWAVSGGTLIALLILAIKMPGGPGIAAVGGMGVFTLTLLCLALAVLIRLGKAWLYTRMVRFSISDQRMHLKRGVFDVRTDNLQMYRVRDVVVNEPFICRVFGRGNVTLISVDESTPRVTLQAIPNPQKTAEMIRQIVQKARVARGVREVETG